MRKFSPAAFAFIFLIALSCTEIFVPDLAESRIQLSAPEDSAVVSTISILFLWEELEGADQYRLQVARPDFISPSAFVLDTLLSATDFTFGFSPGNYQWRVRGISSSSQTPYATRTLTIDTTSDLSSATVGLVGPATGWMNETNQNFLWLPVFSAESYVFRVTSPDATGTLIHQEELPGTAVQYALDEGEYTWGVSARNPLSQSFFSYRSIKIDTTAPSTPVLNSPDDQTVFNTDTVSFLWDSPSSTSGSPQFDTLYIALDAQGSQVIQRAYSVTGGFTDSLSTGTYYWQVRRFDTAGNSSQPTTTRSFQVN